MSPSRYLGLPWPEWGQTDAALTAALHTLDAMVCPCGCGQYADISHDPDTDGWWEMDTDTICYARAAMEQWREDKGHEQLDEGAIPFVRLDPEYRKRPR